MKAVMRGFFLATVVASSTTTWPCYAQESGDFPPACNSAEARQFDFWVGEWNVDQQILQADGAWLELGATSMVSRGLDGCALIESWEGKVLFFWEGMKTAEPLRGLSIRAYDSAKQSWSI